jgi:hypothetical protein
MTNPHQLIFHSALQSAEVRRRQMQEAAYRTIITCYRNGDKFPLHHCQPRYRLVMTLHSEAFCKNESSQFFTFSYPKKIYVAGPERVKLQLPN